MLYKCPVCSENIDLLLYGNVKNFEMECNCGTKLAYDMRTYQLSIVKSKTDNHCCNGKPMIIELRKVKIGSNNAAVGICPEGE